MLFFINNITKPTEYRYETSIIVYFLPKMMTTTMSAWCEKEQLEKSEEIKKLKINKLLINTMLYKHNVTVNRH